MKMKEKTKRNHLSELSMHAWVNKSPDSTHEFYKGLFPLLFREPRVRRFGIPVGRIIIDLSKELWINAAAESMALVSYTMYAPGLFLSP